LAGAISDFFDGRVARRMNSAGRFGQWLDSLADIVFVLTALACEAHAGTIPVYIPILIAASFTQYVVDSLMISGSSTPVRSHVGHWGGVINFALAITLAFAPPPRWPSMLIRSASPLLALFYLAGISERTLSYRLTERVRPFRWTRAS
jgi:phosphatidylglycerophosphate synthase